VNWKIKGYTQKLLSVVPLGKRVNDALQRTVGGLRNFDHNVEFKVADWSYLAGHLGELGISPAGLRYLEIGTGWFPTLPLCWSLAGARSVVTYDLTRHLSRKLTFKLLAALESRLPIIGRAGKRDLETIKAAYGALKTAKCLPELLRLANIEYHAPADATRTGLPDESVDVVFSNSVLEHVPPNVIMELMKESRRVLRRGGLAVHSANCGDHYAYFDKQITFINYLTFCDSDWQFWNNKLLYQNRLRPCDFLELAQQAGLEIALAKFKPRQALLDALPSLRIAPEFQRYPPEQLCSTSIDFVARKP
jgi:hypothetical protein